MMGRKWGNLGVVRERPRQYKNQRRMSLFTDNRDWLGGWPMEFVRDAKAVKF